MLNAEDIRWIKSTGNELNNLLQVITESSQFIEQLSSGSPEVLKYVAMLRNGVERTTEVTRAMLERASRLEAGEEPREVESSGDIQPKAAPGSEVKIYNPDGPRELIMIVDDEDLVVMLAERVLTGEGYRVIVARDGFQCLDIYRKLHHKIALVILDFTMPIMDGSEVFEELLRIDPNVAVVLSSGFTEQDKLRAMLAKGLRGFVPKPYTQQKLLSQVRSTLDAAKAEKSGA